MPSAATRLRARLGVRTSLTKASIYAISGLLAAIAGILVIGDPRLGAYQNGTNLTLMSVAAVVIGGTSLTGGVGGIWARSSASSSSAFDAGLVYLFVPIAAKMMIST